LLDPKHPQSREETLGCEEEEEIVRESEGKWRKRRKEAILS
jgi:hypothetical protein